MRLAREHDRVRFRSSNDVIEGKVTAAGRHLANVSSDDGQRWVVALDSLTILDQGEE